jgi:hypothetical protein
LFDTYWNGIPYLDWILPLLLIFNDSTSTCTISMHGF